VEPSSLSFYLWGWREIQFTISLSMGLTWNPVHCLFIYGVCVELSSVSLYLWGWSGIHFTISSSIGLAWNPVHYLLDHILAYFTSPTW
jgi:hypothetical protein